MEPVAKTAGCGASTAIVEETETETEKEAETKRLADSEGSEATMKCKHARAKETEEKEEEPAAGAEMEVHEGLVETVGALLLDLKFAQLGAFRIIEVVLASLEPKPEPSKDDDDTDESDDDDDSDDSGDGSDDDESVPAAAPLPTARLTAAQFCTTCVACGGTAADHSVAIAMPIDMPESAPKSAPIGRLPVYTWHGLASVAEGFLAGWEVAVQTATARLFVPPLKPTLCPVKSLRPRRREDFAIASVCTLHKILD